MTTDPRDAEIARYDSDLMASRMVKDQWGGGWVRYSDHAAEIARLTAANEQLQYIASANQTRAEKAEAERDAALAQVAGAYEAAALLIEQRQGSIPHRQEIAAEIRALTPADALAALSRRDAQMRAEGRKEGLREAAEWIESVPQSLPNRQEYTSHLGALAEKEAGNG